MRLVCDAQTNAAGLYRQLAPLMGDQSESPVMPTGDIQQISQKLQQRFARPQALLLWLDRAHFLLQGDGWHEVGLRKLLLALLQGFAGFSLILELREKPPQALLGREMAEYEVRGLKAQDLAHCLADVKPQDPAWQLQGKDLER